jgi:hypothetical protein
MSNANDRDGHCQIGLSAASRYANLLRFWNEIDFSCDTGAADGGVLESIKQEVTEALDRQPPDLVKAESLTCRAFLLYTCNLDC